MLPRDEYLFVLGPATQNLPAIATCALPKPGALLAQAPAGPCPGLFLGVIILRTAAREYAIFGPVIWMTRRAGDGWTAKEGRLARADV